MTDPTPITPSDVKAEVKKEMQKNDYSWIRKDWVVIATLFFILAVLTVVNIISVQRVETAVKQTDIIAECFTPDTRCSTFRAESDRENRKYFQTLMKNTGMCVLVVSGQVNNDEIPFTTEAMNTAYDECIADRTGPAPTSSVEEPPTRR